MAFTGTATVKQVSDSMVRITGLSLGSGASGVIGFFDAVGTDVEVHLPDAFQTKHYTYAGVNVPFQDAIDVNVVPAAALAAFQLPAVIKSGTSRADFRITLTNAFASVTPGMEIYVKFHG